MLGRILRQSFTGRSAVILAMAALAVTGMACKSTLASPSTEGPDATQRPANAALSFEAETFSHGTFSLDEKLGKPVVINFWFPSCPPCVAEMPDLQAAYDEYGDQIEFVGVQQVGLDTANDGRKFLNELGVTYPNIPDQTGEVWIGYEVSSFPTTVFLDSDHVIIGTWNGLISPEALRDRLNSLLET